MLAAHPDLNVLIAMAGIMRVEDWRTPESFLASAEAIVTTNVLGPIRLIAAFIEHLQSRPDATIVTVSSGLAFTPLAVTPSYNATKAAIHMLSECIRLQFAGHEREGRRAGAAVGAHRADARSGGQRRARCRWTSSSPRSSALLESQPDAKEIQVERVKFLRYGEARGDYDQVVATLNAADPHGEAARAAQVRRLQPQLVGAALRSRRRILGPHRRGGMTSSWKSALT